MSTLSAFERSKTWKLSTLFEVSLYALVGLSSVMLAISEGFQHGTPPQCFTILFLIAAFFVVDRGRAWFLPWWAAGCLGIVSLVAAFWNVPQHIRLARGMPLLTEEHQLELIFAGAHLLVYLSWIVLFLQKTNQQYWWLWALAVLEIAVGASQSTESLFGVMLSGYLFLALWTLSVFSLLQGQQQFDRAQQIAKSTEPEEEAKVPAGGIPSGESRAAALWRRPSSAIGNVQRDPSASWINPRFLCGVLGTACVSFVLAMLFFFLIPRHPRIWTKTAAEGERDFGSATGFSRDMALGDIGEILESTKRVMEVRLSDYQTGKSLDIEKYAFDMGFEEPLFRGMTINEYEGGQWYAGDGANDDGVPLPELPTGIATPLVKQQIRLESIDPLLLFAMPPAQYGELEGTNKTIYVERLNGILKRDEASASVDALSYAVVSPKFLDTPGAIPVPAKFASYLKRRLGMYLKVPQDLPNLRRLALEKSGIKELPPPGKTEIARRLQSYLKASGEFRYTLKANVTNPNIDPLEDFLLNRKMGHCEYFASALVLMLRSVEIPARLVSGFKGGSHNDSTGWFEVEERHAHAWVEAYIDEKWQVLDPTPAGRAESVASIAAAPGSWQDFRNSLRNFWSRFIVNLSGSEQEHMLEPLKRLVSNALAWLRNGRGHFSNFVTALKHQLQEPERWISWQGGLVTFLLLTVLSAIVWTTRALWRLVAKLRLQYFDPQKLARTVAFHERFRRICARAGLSRKPANAQRIRG